MRNFVVCTAIGLCFLCVSGCRTAGGGEGPKLSKAVGPREPRVRMALQAAGLPAQGMWKCDPVFMDVNGDGAVDLVAHPRLGDGPHVWLGDGAGGWTHSSEGLNGKMRSCGGGLDIGDINGDGFPDLVIADHCDGVFVFLNDGRGHWTMEKRGIYPAELVPPDSQPDEYIGAEDIALGDLNGDGFPDFVIGASDNGGVNVFLGDGTGTNWTRLDCGLPTTGWANRVVATDVNKDGSLDIVASYSEGIRVWVGDGRGGFSPASEGLPTPLVQGLYTGIAAGDINEDGLVDIASANWVDGPEVYLQQEDGSWAKTPDVFPQMLGGAYGLALGDIDLDGHLDMVVSGRLGREVGYVYGVFLLRGDGRGGWKFQEDSGLPNTGLAFTFGVTTGDVNDDGAPDIAAGSGGVVGTDPKRTEPTIAERILVWRTQLPSARDSTTVSSRLSAHRN